VAAHPRGEPSTDPSPRRSGLALASSTIAAASLIGGWTYAASLQSAQFSAIRDSISALAARDTPHREVMTAALLLTGAMHVVTAANVPELARPGRLMLSLGGVLTAGVAMAPLPARSEGSAVHFVVAAASFAALALWPWWARPRGGQRPVAVALCLLVASLLFSLGSGVFGLHERIVAGALVLWPWVYALSRHFR
jgi:hypothetical protein